MKKISDEITDYNVIPYTNFQSFICLERGNGKESHYDFRAVCPQPYTKLHSKADRGGDEESTQAYVLVRRGV